MSPVLQQTRHFFREIIWSIEPSGLNPLQRLALRLGQVGSRVVQDFYADRCLLRASALTYTSLLSFVPLLALMFSVLKGLGVQNRIEPLILQHIAVGSEEAISRIIEYINNTNVARLGTVGLVTLLLTVLTLLSNIEDSFNAIWNVRETRSLMRRFSDYFSVVILGPIFLLLAVTMTATLEAQAVTQKLMEMAYIGQLILFLFNVLPYLAMWAAFAFLYIFMPNIKVHLRAALVGGIFGGTLWQIGQWAYVNFQVGVSKYNAIYGTMAALPILMVWIYISWLIVLLGLEVTYAWQNLGNLRKELGTGDANFASRELMALALMLVIAERFQQGQRPWSLEELAAELKLPPRQVRRMVDELVRLELLSEVRMAAEEQVGYQPAVAPDALEVHRLIKALEESGTAYELEQETPARQVVREIAEALRQAGEKALDGMTLRELVKQLGERKGS